MDNIKSKTLSGIIWTFGERVLAQAIAFVVSIILARLLMPEQYAIIALVNVFIGICNVFINSSFSSALIQKKDADDVDFSSVFYFGFFVALLLYTAIFFSASFIADFYGEPLLKPVLRVMGLSLFVSSYKSVQYAYVSKKMQFRKFFWSTLGGTCVAAIVGILFAIKGFGVWALVAQYLTNNLIDTIIMMFTVRWRPKLVFSFSRLKRLLSFGWKILCQGLLFTVYTDLRTLIIGKVYTSEDLAYYNKGSGFPSFLASNINSAISTTFLPAISSIQEDKEKVRNFISRFVKTGSYMIMPLMAGLAIVAEPLVELLLTEKWLPCVPFIQLFCISWSLIPLQTANSQALTAVGRSDITLIAEIIKRGTNILIILITFRISVMALVIGEICSSFISFLVNTIISKKLFGYGTFSQIKDLLPTIILCGIMIFSVYLVSLIPVGIAFRLILEVLVGVSTYIIGSFLSKNESFLYVFNTVKPFLLKKR